MRGLFAWAWPQADPAQAASKRGRVTREQRGANLAVRDLHNGRVISLFNGLADLGPQPPVIGGGLVRGLHLVTCTLGLGLRSGRQRRGRIVLRGVHVELHNANLAQIGHDCFEAFEHAHIASLGSQWPLSHAVPEQHAPAAFLAHHMSGAHRARFNELGKSLLVDGIGCHEYSSKTSRLPSVAQ
ncbi:hypothetical protein BZM26_31525 [Paraburkholderia strydomiana]|nr:hypothetical protein BZM26_31525 [Paraburkholderia strydomiana]